MVGCVGCVVGSVGWVAGCVGCVVGSVGCVAGCVGTVIGGTDPVCGGVGTVVGGMVADSDVEGIGAVGTVGESVSQMRGGNVISSSLI